MKVSVIVTTYNSAENLRTSIPSVLTQDGNGSEFELEIIAVDNCSQDSTLDVLASYGIITLQNKRNTGGPNRGRNRGMEISTGDVICFLDDDDVWAPNKVKEQLKYIKQVPIVTCACLTVSKQDQSEYLRGVKADEITYYEQDQTFLAKLRRDPKAQNSYMSTIMISSDLKNVRFEEHFGSHDFDWLLRLFRNQSSIQINRNLATRFVHTSNLSRTSAFRVVDYHFAMLTIESYSDSFPKECKLCAERLNATRAKFHYEMGQMDIARRFFKKSQWEVKTALYYMSTYIGSDWVRKNHHVYG